MTTIIGAGSHAIDIRNDMRSRGLEDAPMFAHHAEWDGSDAAELVIAINDPWTRAKVATELGVTDLIWYHEFVYMGTGTFIDGGTHINYGVTMTRTTLGHHCTISPGVTICGDVTIGDRVLVGAGATICDRVTIGSDVTIGAGAVVLPETVIPNGETWVGVPARSR